jgi:hypothetical protein
MTEINTLHDCYRAIVAAAKTMDGKRGNSLDYAVSYAEYGLTLADADRREALNQASRTQALYVRTNLASWRGPTATAVRKRMDQIIGRS